MLIGHAWRGKVQTLCLIQDNKDSSNEIDKLLKLSFWLRFLCPFEMWVDLLDFFCSGIQFYLLLTPYICFISFLYLDLYVL